jgi:uncharacterized coiled-coil protein SlyX
MGTSLLSAWFSGALILTVLIAAWYAARLGAQIMATLADLDAAIAAQGTQITSLQDALSTLAAIAKNVDDDVAALVAQLAAGGTNVPADVTAQIDAIAANTAKLAATTAALADTTSALTAADAATKPPTPRQF